MTSKVKILIKLRKMTTLTLASRATLLIVLSAAKSANPTKIRVTLTASRGALFFLVSSGSSETWFPLLFFLIFIGGIIIIFIILSSIIPNEKSRTNKVRIKNLTGLATICLLIQWGFTHSPSPSLDRPKTIIPRRLNFRFLITLITLYFLIGLWMLSREKLPMRSYHCWRRKLIL